ncbi:right-handed parallel beta-helix repeat-containing protein [Bartonella bovis]|uniref:right-handed parallel beta-helix repeat-containing protein n=1 Tax=Bartonella bovis TaxID=155194 RepID=UPI001ABB7AE9|nr:right-handed parallel beta-helix repeat-containing protein [Bartonella bovis]
MGGEIKNVESGVYATGAGTLNMDDVRISNVGTGVWVKQGTLMMTNGSIGFKGNGNGKGLSIEGTANATITGTTIRGMDGQGTGVWMGSSKTMTMTDVTISEVAMGVEATGTLVMNKGSITFTSGRDNYGVKVGSGVTSARLTDVTITGSGNGATGKGVIMESSKTLKMTDVRISKVKMGVEATAGRLTINGHSRITFNNGAGNYG